MPLRSTEEQLAYIESLHKAALQRSAIRAKRIRRIGGVALLLVLTAAGWTVARLGMQSPPVNEPTSENCASEKYPPEIDKSSSVASEMAAASDVAEEPASEAEDKPSENTTIDEEPKDPWDCPPKPTDAGLDFWITENLQGIDLSGYAVVPGMFGGMEILGSGYRMQLDADGSLTRPAAYVSYTVTAYPDYADGGQYVTGITVTDPAVSIYGLTVNDTAAAWETALQAQGYRVVERGGALLAVYENITFRCAPGYVTVRAEVSNRDGVIY